MPPEQTIRIAIISLANNAQQALAQIDPDDP